MKKLLYIFAFVALAGFSACSSSNTTEPAPMPTGEQVYFSAQAPSVFTLSSSQNELQIPVLRVNTEGALTVSVLSDIKDENGTTVSAGFTVSEKAVFADGASASSIVVKADMSVLPTDSNYTLEMLILGDEGVITTPYGASKLTVALEIPAPWQLLGECLFRDDIASSIFNLDGAFHEIRRNMYEYDGKPGYYYVETPYGPEMIAIWFDASVEEMYDYEGGNWKQTKFIIDATNPQQVIIPEQELGVLLGSSYGWISTFTIEPGTLVDGFITFPTDGLGWSMSAYNGGAKYKGANSSGMFRVVLPGVEVSDTALEVVYNGFEVAADNTTVNPRVVFTVGEDVSAVKFVVREDKVDAEGVLEEIAMILDGTAEDLNTVEMDTNSKTVLLNTDIPGVYSIVAVPFNGEKAAVENAVCINFYFPGLTPPEPTECNLEVDLNSVAYFIGSSYESNYPSSTYAAFLIEGPDGDLDVAYYLMAKTEVLAKYTIDAEFVKANGNAVGASDVADANDGGYLGLFQGLTPATSYTIYVYARNLVGSEIVKSAEHTTSSAAPNAVPFSSTAKFISGHEKLDARRVIGYHLPQKGQKGEFKLKK